MNELAAHAQLHKTSIRQDLKNRNFYEKKNHSGRERE